MAKLPRAREVVRVVKKYGFFYVRQKGSHAIYRDNNSKRITVPVHGSKEISPAVFKQILKDLGINKTDFWKI